MSVLAPFATMSTLSAQMLEAARANDWDRLAALEKDLASQREQLRRDSAAIHGALTAQQRAQAEALIRGILDNDARIREIVDPWLESARQLLSRGSRERNLRSSYGAFTQAP